MAAHRAYQQAMINSGQYLVLLAEYRRRLAADGKNASNYYLLASIEEEAPKGPRLIEEGLLLEPSNPWLMWARDLYEAVDLGWRGKEREMLEVIDKHPSQSPFYRHLVRSHGLANLRRWTEALEEADRAIAVEPHDPEGYLLRATIHVQKNEPAKALESLNAASRLGDFAAIHTALAGVYLSQGNTKEAETRYRLALKAPRDNICWACSRMAAHFHFGQEAQAERHARLALRQDARNTCAREALSGLALKRRDYETAEAEARMILEQNPSDSSGIQAMARVHTWRGRHGEAASLFEKALEKEPDNVDYLLGFGLAAVYASRCDDARTLLRRAKRLLPDSPDVNRALGMCALAERNYHEAANHFGNVLQAVPNDSISYEWLGMMQFQEGFPEAGRVSLRKAIKFAPATDKQRIQDALKAQELALKAAGDLFPKEKTSEPISISLTQDLAVSYLLAHGNLVGRPWSKERPLVHSEGAVSRIGRPVWSPDGRTLYLVSEGIVALDVATGRSRPVLDRPRKPLDLSREEMDQLSDDRHGASTSTAKMKLMAYLDNRISGLHLSPDGRTLYYEVGSTSGTRSLNSVERIGVDGHGHAVVVPTDSDINRLTSDGTGNGLIVERWREKPLRIDLSSGEAKLIPKAADCASDAAVSPGGRYRICSDEGRHRAAELRSFDTTTGQKRFFGIRGSHPSWSPDGKKVAYIHAESELRLLDPFSGRTQRIVIPFEKDLDSPHVMSFMSRGVLWSPDSRYILYTLGFMRERASKKPLSAMTVIADLAGKKAWYAPELFDNTAWSPVPIAQ